MHDIIEFNIEVTAPILKANFDKAKERLIEKLKPYEIAVTLENLDEAKEAKKDVAKQAREFEAMMKEKLKIAEEPIQYVKGLAKEIKQLFSDVTDKLTSQIEVFQDVTRAKCEELLKEEVDNQCIKLVIQDEFKKDIDTSDLIKLTSLTKKLNLTQAAKDAVLNRVQQALNLQHVVTNRLLELENLSLKAGLASPLERRHVEIFLKDSDSEYKAKLDVLFKNEVKRQQDIEEKLKKREEEASKKLQEEAIKASASVINNEKKESLNDNTLPTGVITDAIITVSYENAQDIPLVIIPTDAEIREGKINEYSKFVLSPISSDNKHDFFVINAQFTVKRKKGATNAEEIEKSFCERLIKADINSLTTIKTIKS